MRRFSILLTFGVALISSGPDIAHAATAGDPPSTAQIDSAPCFAAAGIGDDDNVITRCSAVIDSEKTMRPERLRALLARATALARKGQDDRVIADYSAALQLDPTLADIFNARGELWRKKGDRPRAVADFAAALKLNPQHEAARANTKALAQELERIGAQMAVGNRPSFNCATAKRAVEKAICADSALAKLDRDIDGANALVLKEAKPHQAHTLRQKQQDYLQRRNEDYGRPGYDLQKAMKARLQELVGADGY
jgi:tetratricopeptide (TPR) repeat protein